MSPTDVTAMLIYAAPALAALMLLEWASYRLRPAEDGDGAGGYGRKDTATNLTLGAGSLLADSLWNVPAVLTYAVLHRWGAPHWEPDWWGWPLVLLAQDFTCYWQHRCHHRVRLLWAAHSVHHSSRRFNFSTAVRQSWTGAAVNLFYVPMVLAGVELRVLVVCGAVSLLYQFWIHTERIGRLPRPVEFLLNTPSHHRVHHASNGGYLDRNFGCILIVWDRVFGTFTAEGDRCVYGLTQDVGTHNPLRVALHEYAAIGRDLRAVSRWRDRAGLLLGAPGRAVPRRGHLRR